MTKLFIDPASEMVCPECGIALATVDCAAHSLTHWPEDLDDRKASKSALKRRAQLAQGGVPAADYRADEKEG